MSVNRKTSAGPGASAVGGPAPPPERPDDGSVDGLVARVAGDRPLVARSVVASILLPLDPPALPAARLVRAGELFGIAEGTSRVALSRMVAAGELEADAGRYRLTGRLLERQARQNEGRRPSTVAWRGRFVVATVASERRSAAARAALRGALGRLRLGELREGLWMRPDNLGARWARLAETDPVATAGHCLWLNAELADLEPTSPAELASRLFDLAGWAARAGELRAALSATLPGLVASDTGALAPGFKVAAAAVRHLMADPLLPDELLPSGWPGAALRADYDAYERAYWQVLRTWLQS